MAGIVQCLYNERTRVPVCYVGCFLQCMLDRAQPDLLGSGIGPLSNVGKSRKMLVSLGTGRVLNTEAL